MLSSDILKYHRKNYEDDDATFTIMLKTFKDIYGETRFPKITTFSPAARARWVDISTKFILIISKI